MSTPRKPVLTSDDKAALAGARRSFGRLLHGIGEFLGHSAGGTDGTGPGGARGYRVSAPPGGPGTLIRDDHFPTGTGPR